MISVHALHGFLGKPEDWNFLHKSDPYTLHPTDVSADGSSFTEWAKNFNRRVRANSNAEPKVLLGYSLGGRLALHALLDDPSLWSAAVIVSANPGLANPADRPARLAADEKWAHRFRTENWNTLMHDWGVQPVFAGRNPADLRLEADFDREALARALTTWSLGRQENLRPGIATLPMPILWVAGEEDGKFSEIMKKTFRQETDSLKIIRGAAHRVPWEKPELFREIFCGFIGDLLLKKIPYEKSCTS